MTCIYLGYAQGWWSVVGLVIEIGGFIILAIDVSKEYSRYRKVESLRAGALAAQREVDASVPPDKPGETPEDRLRQWVSLGGEDNLRERLVMLRRTLDRTTARIAWLDSLPKEERVASYTKTPTFQVIASQLLAAADRIAAEKFRPAPVRFGIFLVLLGASFQVVGSWPCS